MLQLAVRRCACARVAAVSATRTTVVLASRSRPVSRAFSSQDRERDSGAAFSLVDEEERSQRGVASASLSEASGSFRRSGGSGILAPRGSTGGRRVDDPQSSVPSLSPAMLGQLNSMTVRVDKDESVPIGTPVSGSKLRPQKGGRAIGPADVVEQRGKLTPLQIHRILATLQQRDPAWPVDRIARAYSVSTESVESLRSAFILPFVYQDDSKTWHATPTKPAHLAIQRAVGHQVKDLDIIGGHLRIEKKSD